MKNLNIEKVIDIGAHRGEFLEYIMKLDTIKDIYAFEPQKKIFNDLEKKFSKSKNINLYNFALDKETSNKKIYINKFSMTSTMSESNESSLYLKFKNYLTGSKNNFDEEYIVPTNTVDNFFDNSDLTNTLMKIDVEGYEMNVIQGSQNKIDEIKFILIENQFGNHYKNCDFEEIKKFLFSKNFFILKKFIFPTMHYQDVLFVKKN